MLIENIHHDNMSNNLANVNTHGFKKGRVLFQDLLYQDIKSAGAVTAAGINHPSGIQMGMGVATVAIQKIHSQGNYDNTGNFTEKIPSLDTDILKALSGIFIPGSSR